MSEARDYIYGLAELDLNVCVCVRARACVCVCVLPMSHE